MELPAKVFRHLTLWSQAGFRSRYGQSFRSIADYFGLQAVAGYIGWLGHQNSGDEAIYLALKKLFPKLQILIYPDSKPLLPLELEIYRRWVKPSNFYDLVFLGGGTLIYRQLYRNGGFGRR